MRRTATISDVRARSLSFRYAMYTVRSRSRTREKSNNAALHTYGYTAPHRHTLPASCHCTTRIRARHGCSNFHLWRIHYISHGQSYGVPVPRPLLCSAVVAFRVPHFPVPRARPSARLRFLSASQAAILRPPTECCSLLGPPACRILGACHVLHAAAASLD